MSHKLTEFKVLTFDCYGTLIDWESGIWDALQPLLMHNSCERVTRDVALQAFGGLETRQQSETPDMLYAEVLSRVHGAFAGHFELDTTSELDETFGKSVAHWPAFADSADALRVLKRHYRLVILSNVHREGFAASNRKLGVEFDAVYTAQDIGSYKPNAANFEYLLKRLRYDLDLESKDVLHTAQSLHHDHVPAKAIGLANAWIDRPRLSEGGQWGATAEVKNRPETDFLFFTLMEMATAVQSARS